MTEKRYFSETHIKDLFFKFVGCSSISGTAEEVTMGNLIYDEFKKLEYFKAHPEYLNKHFLPKDRFGRFAVTAMVRGKGKQTVILLNHFDVVDYDGFGKYKEFALRPEELTQQLDPDFLDEDARQDLLSGQWIFGRGTGDMKFGGAMEVAYVAQASITPDFQGNVIFLGVPDEENNSAGMLAAIPALNEIRREYDLEYQAVIVSEPHLKEGDAHCMDLGSVGKIMPAVFCCGKEGHSGLLFQALNAVPMLAEVARDLEFSMDFVDMLDGTYTYPPTTLKMSDNKTLYNVTMPSVAYLYFTVSTLTLSAENITSRLKTICAQAMARLNDKIKAFCREYGQMTGETHQMNWQPKIYSYHELYEEASQLLGSDFEAEIAAYMQEQTAQGMDERDATINTVKEVLRLHPNKEPKVVIAYIPPFYSHSVNYGKTAVEKRVLACAQSVKQYSQDTFGEKWNLVSISKQISDLSCCNVGDMSAAAEFLAPNMPLMGNGYMLPIDDLQEFNVPPINIGYYAKDLHQPFERMHKDFAFRVAPALMEHAIDFLLKGESEEHE